MPLIEWKDDFSTGFPDVDYEHREMIELINTLHAHLVSGKADMSVLDFLGEIFTKISAHFALEEKIMRNQNYDQYQDHKEDHERLLDEIRDMMDEFEDEATFNEEIFAERLRLWFTEHFRTKDARLHRHLG